ncbi:MAG: flavodoxin [Cyanobacteria bacterium P01_C01_bin.89]
MAKVGLFFDTQTGKTADIAEQIQSALGGDSVVELNDINDVELDKLSEYECLIVGSPTWNVGELPDGWGGVVDDLSGLELAGKKIAYFGVGDQIGYADNFLDAMGILEKELAEAGAETVVNWSTDGYEFEASEAQRGDVFVGLGLDEDNQPEKTEERIAAWSEQVKTAFSL